MDQDKIDYIIDKYNNRKQENTYRDYRNYTIGNQTIDNDLLKKLQKLAEAESAKPPTRKRVDPKRDAIGHAMARKLNAL
jgi:hypothetical protein